MPNEAETKRWYQSKTLWGVLISVVGKLGAVYFGVQVTDGDVNQATDAVVQLASADNINSAIALGTSFVGDAFAYYGRLKAGKTIGK